MKHSRQFPTLATERLTLRAPEARDLNAYMAFYTNAEASQWYGGPLRPDQVWRRLAEDIGHWHLKGFGMWMLVRRDDGQSVGGVGLAHPEGWPRHELTWWLLPHSRGTGLAQEASVAIMSFAINSLGWPSVETHIRDGNLPAHRLAVRLGGEKIARGTFPDGFDRDVYRLAPTKTMPFGGLTESVEGEA
ncbi:MAG: GNAT family N-acetyltransferase [Pseudomonadota bacterium]